MQQTPIPAKLKEADLTRFINRATQLENIKPVIAYWCEYWIVNQILTKGLHNGDPETLEFTTKLIDKLEQIKAENPEVDAILDDKAGQIYVLQFALEIFQRAEKALRANKATKQTASTFQAAATFFELINIWTTPEHDILAKIKYSKWNAVRILRAISEGRDPNISDSKLETFQNQNLTLGEPENKEAEVNLSTEESLNDNTHLETLGPGIQLKTSELNSPTRSWPKTLVSHKENQEQISDHCSSRDSSLENGSPRMESEANINEIYSNIDSLPEVPVTGHAFSNLSPERINENCDFDPEASNDSSEQGNFLLGRDFESFPAPKLSDGAFESAQNSENVNLSESKLFSETHSITELPRITPTVVTDTLNIEQRVQPIIDDISIAKAQKHARWAISALNFEDTETAIKELKEALKTLGIQ
ncbi:Vacuolar protein sorting-associated protein vts1 [Erysiphe necator]|nr:Vacuolar protein sorting-associated protein vts1 [Erysiphe necator]